MKHIKLLSLFLLIASVSFGQLSFGDKVGLNMSNLSIEGNSDLKSKIGLDFGFYAEYGLNDQFSIQLPLMYTTKGAKQKSGGVTYRTALDYVELQPNIIYKKTVKNNAFFALVGAYYAPFAFGTYKASKKVLGPKGDSKTQTINMGRGKDDEMKSTDFGLNLAVGIDMKNNGRFGIQYELGLMNISNAEEGSAKNRSFSIFFTTPLNFGKKKNS